MDQERWRGWAAVFCGAALTGLAGCGGGGGGSTVGLGTSTSDAAAVATAAIEALHGQDLGGRDMVVNLAKPMVPRAAPAGGYGGNRH